MFTFSVNWLVMIMSHLFLGAAFIFCLITLYKSQKERNRNIATFFVIICVILLSFLNYHDGLARFIGTTGEFKRLDDNIVFRLDSRWEGEDYSLVQRLDGKNQIIDRRIIKNVPSEIRVGTIFILKDGKFFLHQGEIKKQ